MKYYKRYADDTLLLIKPSNVPALLKLLMVQTVIDRYIDSFI